MWLLKNVSTVSAFGFAVAGISTWTYLATKFTAAPKLLHPVITRKRLVCWRIAMASFLVFDFSHLLPLSKGQFFLQKSSGSWRRIPSRLLTCVRIRRSKNHFWFYQPFLMVFNYPGPGLFVFLMPSRNLLACVASLRLRPRVRLGSPSINASCLGHGVGSRAIFHSVHCKSVYGLSRRLVSSYRRLFNIQSGHNPHTKALQWWVCYRIQGESFLDCIHFRRQMGSCMLAHLVCPIATTFHSIRVSHDGQPCAQHEADS